MEKLLFLENFWNKSDGKIKLSQNFPEMWNLPHLSHYNYNNKVTQKFTDWSPSISSPGLMLSYNKNSWEIAFIIG